jgi:hypothetical protein
LIHPNGKRRKPAEENAANQPKKTPQTSRRKRRKPAENIAGHFRADRYLARLSEA